MDKLMETERRLEVARGWGEGETGESSVNGYRDWAVEKLIELDGGDGCLT